MESSGLLECLGWERNLLPAFLRPNRAACDPLMVNTLQGNRSMNGYPPLFGIEARRPQMDSCVKLDGEKNAPSLTQPADPLMLNSSGCSIFWAQGGAQVLRVRVFYHD